MEKFTNWRDKGTGISPFMPIKPPLYDETGVMKYIQYAFKLLIFLIKAPIAALLLSIYFITSIKAILRFVLLVVFGFKNYEVLADGVKRSNTLKLTQLMPHVGDLVVANYSSPLDGFLFALGAETSWRRVAILIPGSDGNVYEYSIWSLFGFTFTGVHTGSKVDLSSPQLKKKACFLLLEGTPSNGKAVLPFQNTTVSGFNFKLLVVKFAPQFLTLPVPYISKLRYIFELLSMSNIQKSFIKVKVYDLEGKFSVPEIKNMFELNSLSVLDSRLNLSEKQKFWEYYSNKKSV